MLIQPSSMNSSGRELYSLFGVSFFWKASKHLSQRGGLKLRMELTFKRKPLSCTAEILKVFLHPSPLWREKVYMLDETYRDYYLLSIQKIRLCKLSFRVIWYGDLDFHLEEEGKWA
jgi:hypothetical protein